jgi:hypothetical protein
MEGLPGLLDWRLQANALSEVPTWLQITIRPRKRAYCQRSAQAVKVQEGERNPAARREAAHDERKPGEPRGSPALFKQPYDLTPRKALELMPRPH